MNRRYMEVIVLGLISALRPASSQVAVLALLRAPAAPRTLLVFTAAGFVFSVLVGLLGVSVLDDADRVFRHSTFHAAFLDLAVLTGDPTCHSKEVKRRAPTAPRRRTTRRITTAGTSPLPPRPAAILTPFQPRKHAE